jgi:hypothetical protein
MDPSFPFRGPCIGFGNGIDCHTEAKQQSQNTNRVFFHDRGSREHLKERFSIVIPGPLFVELEQSRVVQLPEPELIDKQFPLIAAMVEGIGF